MLANSPQVGNCALVSASGTARCGENGYECPTCRVILAQRVKP